MFNTKANGFIQGRDAGVTVMYPGVLAAQGLKQAFQNVMVMRDWYDLQLKGKQGLKGFTS